VEAVGEHS